MATSRHRSAVVDWQPHGAVVDREEPREGVAQADGSRSIETDTSLVRVHASEGRTDGSVQLLSLKSPTETLAPRCVRSAIPARALLRRTRWVVPHGRILAAGTSRSASERWRGGRESAVPHGMCPFRREPRALDAGIRRAHASAHAGALIASSIGSGHLVVESDGPTRVRAPRAHRVISRVVIIEKMLAVGVVSRDPSRRSGWARRSTAPLSRGRTARFVARRRRLRRGSRARASRRRGRRRGRRARSARRIGS